MKDLLEGSDPSIRVPRRAITLTDGTVHTPSTTPAALHGDPQCRSDVRAGLAPLRAAWIDARGDTDELEQPTSIYRRGREAMPELEDVRFAAPARRAARKPGANVTQMHYARRGEITPEMEFIAIREGVAAGVRSRRGRARTRDHSVERQPSRERAA